MEKHEYMVVNINDLYPDPENYRFDPVRDENEAIINMVNEITDKLFVLTKSILDNNGLDPSILPNIIPYSEKKDKYIVIEGNRRITAIKIIKNIELIKTSPHYQKFKTLISKYKIEQIPDKYYCTYYSEKSDAQFWIYLRHSGELKGEGLLPWDTLSTQRFKVATGQEKADISYCVNYYLKGKKDMYLPPKTSTTLRRILDSSPGRAYYGLYADNNTLIFSYDEDTTLLKLLLLISYLGDKTINSRNANTNIEIKNWIERLDKSYKAKYEPYQENESTTNEHMNTTATTNNNEKNSHAYGNNSSAQNESPPHDEHYTEGNQNASNTNKDNREKKANENGKSADTSGQKTKSTNSSANKKSKFMDGLIYVHLDHINTKGIYNLCNELVRLSTANYKDYSAYPISSGMLLRSLIEQSFKYHLKKNEHWEALISSKKGKDDPALGPILGYYRNNYKALIADTAMIRTFKILFEKDSTIKDILDLSIHHPHIVNITKPELDRFVELGIVVFINYLLSD